MSNECNDLNVRFDPQAVSVRAVEVDEAYEGLPDPLPSGQEAGWSGFCPKPEEGVEPVRDCARACIKPDGVYREVEVGTNRWMEMACLEAVHSVRCGHGPFGAVLVQIDDETNRVLRYWKMHNHVTDLNDPTAHAEVLAIRCACAQLGVFDLGHIERETAKLPQHGAISHCEIYSSCEPCPMCMAAVYWARIPALVFAATRFDAAEPGVDFSDEAIYEELATPYRERSMDVRQASDPHALDAFNLWKRSLTIQY
jgi:tRNA(Arg) A34 adenosine deaminase TadA